MREARHLSLFDFVPYVPSLGALGLDEDELRQIPAHEEPDEGAGAGASTIGIGELPPNAPSADTSPLVPVGTRQLYVHERDVPPELWAKLRTALFPHRPSGYEKEDILSGTPDVVIHDEGETGNEQVA